MRDEIRSADARNAPIDLLHKPVVTHATGGVNIGAAVYRCARVHSVLEITHSSRQMDVNGLYLTAPNHVSLVRCQTLFRLAWQHTERVNFHDVKGIDDLHNLQESESEDTVESHSSDSETESDGCA